MDLLTFEVKWPVKKRLLFSGPFISRLFGSVQTNSGAFSCLVHFVQTGVKAVNQTVVQTEQPDYGALPLGCESKADQQDFVIVDT